MVSEVLIRSVNIALLGYSSLVAIAMMTSFRRDMLSNRSQRLFFSKIAVATVCMICHVDFCIRGIELRDPLNVVLLSLSHVGVYIVFYLYIEYLRAQIEELDPAHPVPRAILYFSLVVNISRHRVCIVVAMIFETNTYPTP